MDIPQLIWTRARLLEIRWLARPVVLSAKELHWDMPNLKVLLAKKATLPLTPS